MQKVWCKGKALKLCSTEGCTNFVVKGGVCRSHGAMVKQCSYEGCTNQAKKGIVCRRHGAKVKLSISSYAEPKGAQIQISTSTEECVSCTEQWSNNVVTKVGQIMLRKEECAGGTGQSSSDAVTKGAPQNLSSKEECVSVSSTDTGQR